MTWAYVSVNEKKIYMIGKCNKRKYVLMSKYKLYVNNLHSHGFTCHTYGYLHLQTQH